MRIHKDLIPASEERVAGRFFSCFFFTNNPNLDIAQKKEMGKVRKMLFFWRFLDCLPKPLTITPSTAAVKRSRQAFAIRQASRQSVKCVFNYFISAG